jgi:hypothetical protein
MVSPSRGLKEHTGGDLDETGSSLAAVIAAPACSTPGTGTATATTRPDPRTRAIGGRLTGPATIPLAASQERGVSLL